MSRTRPNPEWKAAWGLDLGRDAVRLVRVVRAARGDSAGAAGDGFRVDRAIEIERPDRWQAADPGARGDESILRAAREANIGREPLAACFPDEASLFRVLGLPHADDAALERMVRAQVEAILPGPPDRFAWAWDRLPSAMAVGEGGSDVLLAAGRRDTLDRLRQRSASLGGTLAAVVPETLAATTGFLRLSPPELPEPGSAAQAPGAVLLIHVGARGTGLALIADGRALRWTTVESGADDLIQEVAARRSSAPADAAAELSSDASALSAALTPALRAWVASIREADAAMSEVAAPSGRPRRAVLVGPGADLPGLATAVEAGLLRRVRVASPPAAEGDGSVSPRLYAAAGAAVSLLRDERPRLDLLGTAEARPRVRRRFGRAGVAAAMAAAWIVLATAALYGYERYEAADLADRLARIRRAADGGEASGGLERRLAVGSYLESSAASPLEVFDAISSAAPPSLALTGWQYARSGAVSITGTVGGPAELDGFVRQLATADALEKVEVRRAQTDPQGRGWGFEIAATAVPYDRPKAATRPATAPATVPADKPAGAPAAAAAQGGPVPGRASRPAASAGRGKGEGA